MLLQAVEDEFHAAGNAKFFEDAKKVIPHDLLRGWSARRVALTCYGLTGVISAAGLAVLQWGFVLQLMICLTILGGLLATL